MWNTHYSNRRCRDKEQIKEHKMHLERIVTVKTTLDKTEPVKPTFLVHRSKKEKLEEERQNKIFYENNVLLGKIIDIEKKPSPYNHVVLQPSRCPAYDKTTYQIKKKKFDMDEENLKLYNRLVSAKPHYKTNEVIQDYIQSRYYESMINNTKNRSNPSLLFETPGNFKKKLDSYLSQCGRDELAEPVVTSESKGRPQTATLVGNPSYVSQYNSNSTFLLTVESYGKKPQSGISKASTNTQYLTHNEIVYKMP